MPGPAGRHSGDRAPAAAQVAAVTALTATGPGPDFTIPVCLEEGTMFLVTFSLTYTDLITLSPGRVCRVFVSPVILPVRMAPRLSR